MAAFPSLQERTRLRADPVRNFKFDVQLFHSNALLNQEIGRMGFMNVEGIAMNTDMVTYREGGWNTSPHKLPGQTDFTPVTMSAGVFYDKPGMWDLARQMYSSQWGNGTIGQGEEFRFDMAVRVLDHPVTRGAASGSGGGGTDISGAVMGFQFYNCWVASIGFNGLDASGSAILVHQMQIHHEGFEPFFGNAEAVSLQHAGSTTFIG